MNSLTPEQPRWYRSPTRVGVPIEAFERANHLEEVAVRVKLDGITKTATVPIGAFDEARMAVRGLLIGESSSGEFVLISLPPSSMGGTTIQLKREFLSQLLVA